MGPCRRERLSSGDEFKANLHMAIEIDNSPEINRALIDLALSSWLSKLIFQLDTCRVAQYYKSILDSFERKKNWEKQSKRESKAASQRATSFEVDEWWIRIGDHLPVILAVSLVPLWCHWQMWKFVNVSIETFNVLDRLNHTVEIRFLESDRWNRTVGICCNRTVWTVWIRQFGSDSSIRTVRLLEDAYLVYWLFILIVYKIYLFSP